MDRPRRVSAELWSRAERLIQDLLLREEVPEKERLAGVILFMRGHGLPCGPEQLEKIRKIWLECVADPPQRRKRT